MESIGFGHGRVNAYSWIFWIVSRADQSAQLNLNQMIFLRVALMPVIFIAPCVAASASALAPRGELAARSEASIRISVSVAPRFTAGPKAHVATAQAMVAQNAPGLRFKIIEEPARKAGSLRTLYLVVPD